MKQQIQPFYRESTPPSNHMRMIISPKFSINALKYWKTVFIYHSPILTKEKINSVKQEFSGLKFDIGDINFS